MCNHIVYLILWLLATLTSCHCSSIICMDAVNKAVPLLPNRDKVINNLDFPVEELSRNVADVLTGNTYVGNVCEEVLEGDDSGRLRERSGCGRYVWKISVPETHRIKLTCSRVKLGHCSDKPQGTLSVSMSGDATEWTNTVFWCSDQSRDVTTNSIRSNMAVSLYPGDDTTVDCRYTSFVDANVVINKNDVKCGTPTVTNKIVGGREAQLGQFPWQAFVVIARKNREITDCGGSLVSPTVVVTAAHCVEYLDLDYVIVKLGTVNSRDTTGIGLQMFKVVPPNIIVHPRYADYNDLLKYDIAVLKLPKEVTYTDYVRPICLPTSDELSTRTFVGRTGTFSGFGYTATDPMEVETTKLMFVTGNVISNLSCLIRRREFVLYSNSVICTVGEENMSTCGGDSGGPLALEQDNQWYLIGVVSYGSPRCEDAGPSVNARVTALLNFINEAIED